MCNIIIIIIVTLVYKRTLKYYNYKQGNSKLSYFLLKGVNGSLGEYEKIKVILQITRITTIMFFLSLTDGYT